MATNSNNSSSGSDSNNIIMNQSPPPPPPPVFSIPSIKNFKNIINYYNYIFSNKIRNNNNENENNDNYYLFIFIFIFILTLIYKQTFFILYFIILFFIIFDISKRQKWEIFSISGGLILLRFLLILIYCWFDLNVKFKNTLELIFLSYIYIKMFLFLFYFFKYYFYQCLFILFVIFISILILRICNKMIILRLLTCEHECCQLYIKKHCQFILNSTSNLLNSCY